LEPVLYKLEKSMNHLNKTVFYKNENIVSITVKMYIVYKAIQNYKYYMFFTGKNLLKYIDIFFPFIMEYFTFLIFLAIIWFKSKKISKRLLPKIESIILHKSYSNIVYIALYFWALNLAIDIVHLIILLI
jgi:hypothetical protein